MVAVQVGQQDEVDVGAVGPVLGGVTLVSAATRSVSTGSVSTTRPASSIRTVECPTNRNPSERTARSIPRRAPTGSSGRGC